MKFVIALCFLLLPLLASAKIAFFGDIRTQEDKIIEAGKEYIVPKCKKWMLKDVFRFANETWVSVEGGIEIQLLKNSRSAGKHVVSGKLTYKFGAGEANETVSILPESKVVVFSKESVSSIEIMEYTWVYEKNSSCK